MSDTLKALLHEKSPKICYNLFRMIKLGFFLLIILQMALAQSDRENIQILSALTKEKLAPDFRECFELLPIHKDKLVKASQEMMNTHYQSCEASKLVVDDKTPRISALPTNRGVLVDEGDLIKYRDSHYLYKNKSFQSSILCKGKRDLTSVYALGAKPLTKSKKIVSYDLAKEGCIDPWCPAKGCSKNGVSCDSTSVKGLDCSGYIAAIFARAGLKFSTNTDIQYSKVFFGGTDLIHTLSLLKSSCLTSLKGEQIFSLAPGDLINLGGNPGHIVMVDETSADPLGLEKMRGKSVDCKKIDVSYLDFSFTQSGQPWGVSRVHMGHYKNQKKLPRWIKNILESLKLECRKIQGEKDVVQVKEMDKTFSILRHSNEDVQCREGPIELEYQECLGECL